MRKNIIIIILTILVIGLSGYIIYDKLLSQKEIPETHTKENKNETNEVQENDISWIDYLLEQKFVSATLHVCSIDGNYVYNKDTDFQPNPGAGRNLTQEEFKTILNTINESNTEDNYGEIGKSNRYAAPACEDSITYKYIHEDKEYEFVLADASIIIFTEDEDFIKILNSQINDYPYYTLNKDNSNYFNLVKEMMKGYIKY